MKYFRVMYNLLRLKPLKTTLLKRSLNKLILRHFSTVQENTITAEQREVIQFIRENTARVFPYRFSNNYSAGNIAVSFDRSNDLRYVLCDGKRLYFKKRWKETRIQKAYSSIKMEQDPDSPHCYLTDSFDVERNSIVADIGAAEGFFALSVIEKVKKIYLFEDDPEWIQPLKATFSPWPEKVEMINRSASEVDSGNSCRLDTFFKSIPGPDFIKLDVDGAERGVLEGCSEILSSRKPLKIDLAIYHRITDQKEFAEMLEKHDFKIMFSKGFMLNYYDLKIKPPFLRKGLIYATRK